MTKAKYAPSTLRRKKKVMKAAKGQYGARSKKFRTAKEAVRDGLIYNYIDRKKRKRDFRTLWITRITAACRAQGVSYSRFISGLKKAGVDLNRKVLADIAANDERGFQALVKKAKV